MFSSTSFMGSLKKIWVSGLLDIYSNVWCEVWPFLSFFQMTVQLSQDRLFRSPSCPSDLRRHFIIYQIPVCAWAKSWTSYSVSLLFLATHAPNYAILIAGALWYILISGRTYRHHTAFLFQFFCLVLIIISYQLQYQLQEKQKTNPSSVFSQRSWKMDILIFTWAILNMLFLGGYLWGSVLGWIMFRPKDTLKFQPPLQNVTLFGNKAFTKVIKLKWDH